MEGVKRCSKCKQYKLRKEFSPDRRWGRDGLQSHCRPCKAWDERERRQRKPEHIRALDRARYRKSFPARQASERKWKYGLTDQQFKEMFAEQGERCKICRTPFAWQKRGPSVDHDHKTGAVRGLLCGACNRGLEPIERPGFVEAARAYLQDHARKQESA